MGDIKEQHIVCTEKETLNGLLVLVARTEERVVNLDKRINGSLKTYQDHIVQGKGWRMAIIGTLVMIVLQIIGFAFVYGTLSKTVNVNERIIQRVLDKYEHLEVGGKK